MISAEELHEWFIYEPDTGLFRWRKRPQRMARSHNGEAGSIYRGKNLRRVLSLQGRRVYAARAAYIMSHGDIPANALIDHADGDTLNDRIENLRLASSAQNTWNRLQRNGVPMPTGVCRGDRGLFLARIQLPTGQKISLGTWNTETEAHAAYMGAAAILHGEFWVGLRD